MRQKTIELWVGALTILGLLALFFLCIKVAGGDTRHSLSRRDYQLTAYFSNIGDLKEGAPIRSAGVLVGRVKGISLDPQNYQAKVVLGIDPRYTFSKDAAASILTLGILGEQYVDLQEGGDLENLHDGDQVKITNSALIIEHLLNQVLVRLMNQSKN